MLIVSCEFIRVWSTGVKSAQRWTKVSNVGPALGHWWHTCDKVFGSVSMSSFSIRLSIIFQSWSGDMVSLSVSHILTHPLKAWLKKWCFRDFNTCCDHVTWKYRYWSCCHITIIVSRIENKHGHTLNKQILTCTKYISCHAIRYDDTEADLEHFN